MPPASVFLALPACPPSQTLLASRDKSQNSRRCLRVEIVQKQSMLYYQPVKSRAFLKIFVSLPHLISAFKGECTAVRLGDLQLQGPVVPKRFCAAGRGRSMRA